MDLLSLLQAYAIMQGSHTGGHFRQATNQSEPFNDTKIKLLPKKFSEDWENWDDRKPENQFQESNKREPYNITKEQFIKDRKIKDANIQGAGFETQDFIRDQLTGKIREDASKMSALIKVLFLSGVTKKISDTDIAQGDIKELQKLSGNKHVPKMLGATILSDLLQKPDSTNSLSFTVREGSPGLLYNRRF